jgi:hypothetical protein
LADETMAWVNLNSTGQRRSDVGSRPSCSSSPQPLLLGRDTDSRSMTWLRGVRGEPTASDLVDVGQSGGSP